MTYPGAIAEKTPDKLAVVNTGTGETLTFGDLAIQSGRVVRVLQDRGLAVGDAFSLMMENRLDLFTIAWAAFVAGFRITLINRYLTAEEAAYIVQDSDAKLLISSAELSASEQLGKAVISHCPNLLSCGGDISGFDPLEPAMATQSATPPPIASVRGQSMLYSSGTTGKPKGVARPPETVSIEEGLALSAVLRMFGFDENSRYLSPAPLYHAAPFFYSTAVQSIGGCVYMMERFDAEDALRCLQGYQITQSQWVPTMFVRMLKLPEEMREQYSFPTHKLAIHAAAPCPVDVKRRMIDWWGPILFEYYAGTEGNGVTVVTSEDWLAHPGTVGKPIDTIVHICDESGRELPVGETGTIYFEPPEEVPRFLYHKDDEKTDQSRHPQHKNWTTLGDVGYMDEEGYLYLTDRKAYMIISGGVNIYPQDIEDALVMHDKIVDAAVFGVPNPDFGEEVKAVVQTVSGVPEAATAAQLEEELIAYCRQKLAAFKVPRSIDFVGELPRLPTGKLYKRLLRDKYWGKQDSRIV